METPSLILDDSRRLTGSNLFMDEAGAVLDALVTGFDKQRVVDVWLEQVGHLLAGVGWSSVQRFYRIHAQGISVGFSAPLDALYTATDINEAAWQLSTALLEQGQPATAQPDRSELADLIKRLSALLAKEQNQPLQALLEQAESRQAPFLVDDELFTLGYGRSSQSWDVRALPDPATLDWQHYQSIPLALVTGTNGKSTSVRLAAHIINSAGRRCGVTTTDFIRVGSTLLDKGDYSGPGGARLLLRHPEVELAVLEVARGGLLRRGLPLPHVDTALVTNIADDHLGQYGINSVEELTAVKMLVAKATRQLILNADDAQLVNYVQQHCPTTPPEPAGPNVQEVPRVPDLYHLPQTVIWFALDETNPQIQAARTTVSPCCFVRNGQIIYATAGQEQALIGVDEIPMTLAGAAVHNVQNALGAVALTHSLGIEADVIRQALASFKSDVTDNPGRGNLFDYRGARIMLDFAHNEHGMDAMASTVRSLPAQRRILVLCHAGDRSEREIVAMTRSALRMQADQVWVSELPDYLRGRELGEVPAIITRTVLDWGLDAALIRQAKDLPEATRQVLEQIQTGDVVFIMALSQRDAIVKLLLD